MNRIARRTVVVLILGALLLFGFGFFTVEYATESSQWVMQAGSPHVYKGENINCGIVTDSNGALLVNMQNDRLYSNSADLRKSTVHWVGDRYGNISAPALSVYVDSLVDHDPVSGLYTYGNTGATARLTLSAEVQVSALNALGDYKGTIGVYNYKTGELVCAVTTPTYDPDNIPDFSADTTGEYTGVYWNRFVQSKYIPGSIFKVVTLAAALEEIPDIQEQTFVCTGSYSMGEQAITCEQIHYNQSLKEAFCNSCNCAFAQISEQLGKENLTKYVSQFGITDAVSFDGITTETGTFDVSDASALSVAWSSIGQYYDEINPCRFMTFIGSIAGVDHGVNPYIVSEISVDNKKSYEAEPVITDPVMSAETAMIIKDYLLNNVESKYGSENFPGLTVCAKTGTGEVGNDQKPNAMITGFVADDNYPFAFIICVEDAGYGSSVCIPMLSEVLAACKNSVDN